MCFGDFGRIPRVEREEHYDEILAASQNPQRNFSVLVHPKDYLDLMKFIHGEDSPEYTKAAAEEYRLKQELANLDDLGIQFK